MSFSPTILQTKQQERQQLYSQSLSPNKMSKNARGQTKILRYQKFACNLTSLDQTIIKTPIKFYEKSNKKIQNTIFKQRIDSIKPIMCHQYQDNQFIIESKQNNNQGQNLGLIYANSNLLNARSNILEGNSQKDSNQTQKIHIPCIGLINPMYINVKSNIKRLTTRAQLTKEKQFIKQTDLKAQNKTIKQKRQDLNGYNSVTHSPFKKQKQTESLYFKIVSEMNEYFNSMKLDSFKNNKAQLLSKRQIKSASQKKVHRPLNQAYSKKNHYGSYPQDQNLNIVGLKPKQNGYEKMTRNLSSHSNSKKIPTPINQKGSLTQSHYQSQQMKMVNSQAHLQIFDSPGQLKEFNFASTQTTSMIIGNGIYGSPSRRIVEKRNKFHSRPFTQDIRNKSPIFRKNDLYKGFCFGQINLTKNTPQQIYRLKILYYKDLLWKNAFNIGIRYFSFKSQTQSLGNYKYVVGRGNNSKIIKNLMSKRWWWSLDSKQQNAHFVWTQLKIYSIYDKQTSFEEKPKYFQEEKLQRINLCDSQKQQTENQNKKICDNSCLVLNNKKKIYWEEYISNHDNFERQKKITEQNLMSTRKKLQNKLIDFQNLQSPAKTTNHLEFSKAIGNKKALYKVMMMYFQKIKKCSDDQIYVPLTYHITAGLQDQQYLKFLSEYYRRSKNKNKTCWIVKPGQLTNRGKGIKYCRDLNEIKPIVKRKEAHQNGSLKTFLIQEYIDRPLLYKGRKFDIRHYIMLSTINGKIRGYFYQGGYVRTTSYKYKLDDNSPAIHLTNDAVQKYCKDYGRYEKGNKLSYEQLDEYIQEKFPCQNPQKKTTFFNTIHPQIRKISTDVIHAAYYFVDPRRKINNFQIFGLDIMIDEGLKCYLIQVNTNPCLQLSSPVLRNVIPDMLDNSFALTLDLYYPPPEKQILNLYHKKYKYPMSVQNKFQLVFDEDIDGQPIKKIYQEQNIQTNQMSGIGDDDENFESCQEDDQDC